MKKPSCKALVQLRGDNQKEELSIYPEELFYITSADNYVRIQYRLEGIQKSVLIRSTLKKMEEQLLTHPSFFRCHRMYLVNLQLVTSVMGNAQGLRLQLNGLEEPIPVSRSLTETVKEKLHQLSHSSQKV
jgi:DNA-binding LytR/AlgR family response regulator